MKFKYTIKKSLQILLVSLFVGILICLYLTAAGLVIDFSNKVLRGDLIDFVRGLVVASMLLISLLLLNAQFGKKWYDNGRELIEGYYEGKGRWNPFKHIFFVFFNSLMAFFSGFLLGSEAPSVMMGSSCGLIVSRVSKDEDMDLVKCAGSAGFAVAYMSPVAGLCHLIEENKKHLSFKLIVLGLPTIALSFGLAYLFQHYIYHFHSVYMAFDSFLPFNYYPLLLLIGFLSVVVAKMYFIGYKMIARSKTIMRYMDIITFVIAIGYMVLRRFYPFLVGSGSSLFEAGLIDYAWYAIIGILLFRIVNTSLSFEASLSGGVVVPALAMGAVLSDLLVNLFVGVMPGLTEYASLIRFVGMLSVFASVSGNFLTSFALIFNSTFFFSVLPTMVSLAIAKIFDVLSNKLINKAEAKADRDIQKRVV